MQPTSWRDKDSDGEGEDEHDKGSTPNTVNRHCTDCFCGVIFLLGLGFQAMCFHYGYRNGDARRFAHLPLANGSFCGLDAGVKDTPLLYLCPSRNRTLSYKEAICVASCGAAKCAAGEYPAEPFAGMLCMPDRNTSKALAAQSLRLLMEDPNFDRLMEFRNILKARSVLVGSAVASIVFGYLFLFFVEKCASCLIWLGFGSMTLVTGSFGAFMLYVSRQPGGLDGLPSTGDAQKDQTIAYVCLALCLLSMCILICFRKSVNKAIECISSSAECIAETPSLLVEPAISILFRLFILVLLLTGFALLLSTGRVEISPEKGLRVRYSQDQKAYLLWYFFYTVWMLELCNAMSTFVIAYTTQLWFFKEGSVFSMCKAYCAGMGYHFGTLAMGSFIIAVTRCIRILATMVTAAMKDTANPVIAAVACCCTCVVSCFERFLQKLNKFAYMDVAINSNNFCTAAGHAMTILTHNATTVVTMEGATFMVEIAGVGGITAVGGLTAYLACTKNPEFSDPSSASYVQDPMLISIVAAVISFFLSLPFAITFSTVSDAILFCFAIERQRTPAKEESASFIQSCKACFRPGRSKDKREVMKKPEYDDSRHPARTQALLSKVADSSESKPRTTE